MIQLESGAGQAIRSFLDTRGGRQPIRVELQSSGCCDASLVLRVDEIRRGDLVEEQKELTLVISSETNQLVGDVTISYREDAGRKGFVLTSTKPVSEWSGFGVSDILVRSLN
jgi:Fe-S cluster assembly iron-binding protein IscA